MDISKATIAGPCSIIVNGVDVGHTLEGIDIAIERHFADVNVDKYGDTPIDQVLTGTRATISFKLAQPTWRQYNLAMPETSSYDGAGSLDRVDIGGDAGYSLRQDAVQVVIHPLSRLGDLSQDVTFYKAVSVEPVEVPYKVDEQVVVPVTMLALVDEAYGAGRRLGHIGAANVS